jgi:hypothetical protein
MNVHMKDYKDMTVPKGRLIDIQIIRCIVRAGGEIAGANRVEEVYGPLCAFHLWHRTPHHLALNPAEIRTCAFIRALPDHILADAKPDPLI